MLIYAIAKRLRDAVNGAHTMGITAPNGTDIRCDYDPHDMFHITTEPLKPGGRTHFPTGSIGIYAGEWPGVRECSAPKVAGTEQVVYAPARCGVRNRLGSLVYGVYRFGSSASGASQEVRAAMAEDKDKDEVPAETEDSEELSQEELDRLAGGRGGGSNTHVC
jgi:hypothetical protein